jgi:hypothetical protein
MAINAESAEKDRRALRKAKSEALFWFNPRAHQRLVSRDDATKIFAPGPGPEALRRCGVA